LNVLFAYWMVVDLKAHYSAAITRCEALRANKAQDCQIATGYRLANDAPCTHTPLHAISAAGRFGVAYEIVELICLSVDRSRNARLCR
jgi:hypothetical protein